MKKIISMILALALIAVAMVNEAVKLRENGILVRHFSSPKICEYNRITVGSEEQTKALLNALKIIVKEISK